MPSPFPGMDPYLEHPEWNRELHLSFVVYLSEVLQSALPPPYYAIIRHRIWMEKEEEIVESYLEICTAEPEKRVATVIEVLSPAVKTPGDAGSIHYLRTREELLRTPLNLVEIDLLRGGESPSGISPLCLVRLHGEGSPCEIVYPIPLAEPLPRVAIPLHIGDEPVTIDLQRVFDRCYDTGPYRRANAYRLAPIPPLSPEQAAWAEQLLRDKNLLPPA